MPAIARAHQVGLADAKNRLSALANEANETGSSFVIMKNNVPWIEMRPLATRSGGDRGPVRIEPIRHEVVVADIDELFDEYDGTYVPQEDSFAAAAGSELM